MNLLIFKPADLVSTLTSITLKKVSEEGKWLVFEMGPPSYKKVVILSQIDSFSLPGVLWLEILKALILTELFPFIFIQQSVGLLKGLFYDSVGT